MSKPNSGRWRRLLFPGSALLLVLLALPWLVPKSRLVTRMRGEERPGDELNQVKGLGYYEALMDGPDREGRDQDGFPPGFVAIADSGILELDPGYLRWGLRPGLDLRWNGTTFRTGRLGNRGPDVGLGKPKAQHSAPSSSAHRSRWGTGSRTRTVIRGCSRDGSPESLPPSGGSKS